MLVKHPYLQKPAGAGLNFFCGKQSQVEHGKAIKPIDQGGLISELLDHNLFMQFLSKQTCQGVGLRWSDLPGSRIRPGDHAKREPRLSRTGHQQAEQDQDYGKKVLGHDRFQHPNHS